MVIPDYQPAICLAFEVRNARLALFHRNGAQPG